MEFNFEQLKTEQKEPDLENFRKEIQGLKEAEEEEMRKKEAGGTTGSVHLRGLNPEELTIEDAAIYEKFRKLELTKEEYAKWRQNVVKDVEARAPEGPVGSPGRLEFFNKDSRYIFMQYVANKIGTWQSWEEKRRKLNDFREEIAALKEKEVKKEKERLDFNPHLTAINPENLNFRDMEIYKKFKEGSLKDTSDEFRAYRKEIFRDCQEYFRQLLIQDKHLREQVDQEINRKETERPASRTVKESEKIFHTPTYLSFQEVFSRNNFLAWIQNEILKKAYERKKIISEITHA